MRTGTNPKGNEVVRWCAVGHKTGIDPASGKEMTVEKRSTMLHRNAYKAQELAENAVRVQLTQHVLWFPADGVTGTIVASRRVN
jgi:hypothetical protein